MNFDIDDGLSPFRRKKNRLQDKYAASRRSISNSSRRGRGNRDYQDEGEEYIPPYGQRDRSYTQKRNIPPYEQPDRMPTFRGDQHNVPPVRKEYTRNNEDEGYEDYGEIGSNFSPSDDPSWGYDNPDRYDYDYSGSSANEDKAPDTIDFSEANVPPARETRKRTTAPYSSERAPSRIDFSNARYSGNNGSSNSELLQEPRQQGARNNNDDLKRYMEYIDKYDNGEIDNHDMSRVQRRYANSSFWDTFNPSEKMIREYGSGNESTKWPLFEKKDGRWKPINWRND